MQYVRDPLGRITQIIDPAGNPIVYTYDASGDLRSFSDQVGLTTQYTYLGDPAHFLDTIVDPRGKTVFDAEFDADGRLISSTDAVGNSVQTDYDAANLTETVTDGSGNPTTTTFDARGNVLSVTDPHGTTRSFQYDAANNITSASDDLGHTVTRVFDSRGNITSMTDPLGQTSTATFTADNQVKTATDASGHTGTLVYDDHGRLIQYINAEGDSSFITYDDQGRKASFIDNLGLETKYEYGVGPHPTKVIYADGTTELFEYDHFDHISARSMNSAKKRSIRTTTPAVRSRSATRQAAWCRRSTPVRISKRSSMRAAARRASNTTTPAAAPRKLTPAVV